MRQRILATVRELVEDDSRTVSEAASQFLSAVMEAEEQARREAEQRQAEEQACREAEQRQAEEQARREAEQRQAEERARREAEQRQAEEQACREAEQRQAEERARREAEQRQAEERARREAEQRQAEERACREAEQRQAEEQARREAEQRQAEEQACREAEQRQAEERARREAEEAATREAEDRARREALREGAARSGRPLAVTGLLAIGGAALLVVGLPLVIMALSGASRSAELAYWLYVIIISGFTVAAAACLLRPVTRWLVGPGLLLGVSAGALWGLLFLLIDRQYAPSGAGWWLEFAGLLVLVLAAGLAAAVLARTREVRLVLPRRHDWLAWLVVLLGAVGALALVREDTSFWHTATGNRSYVWPSVWATIAAVVVPTCAAAAVPRRFGAALLVGWLGGGAAIIGPGLWLDSELGVNGFILFFGVTLVALLAVTVLFARAGPRPNVEGPPAA